MSHASHHHRLDPIALALIGLTCLWAMSGCATIFNGKQDAVTITSTPPGANVTLNQTDTESCPRTPCTVSLNDQQEHAVRVMLPGYESFEGTLKQELEAGWIVAGIFFWPSLIVDFATQRWYRLGPDPLNIKLEKAGQGLLSRAITPPRSVDHRRESEMAAHFGTFFANLSGFGVEANLALFFDADTHLELNGQFYEAVFSPGSIEYEASFQGGAQIRQFIGNSFNFRVGAGLRRSRGTLYLPFLEQINTSQDYADVRYQSFVATLALGNQWQWEHFNIGIDYLGASIPLQTGQIRVFDPNSNSPTLDSGLRSDVTRHLTDAPLWNIRVLNLQLGAAF